MRGTRRPEIKSSAGLGGMGPVESILSPGESSVYISERSYSPVKTFTIPLTFGTPKILCKLGLCRSPSITRVSLPACARTTARFAQVVLLPSIRPGLVTRITVGGVFATAYRRVVQRSVGLGGHRSRI